MRCQEVRSWTFKGLVAAFVDLSVAFSLLCASSVVYLSSKFLGLFGLNLPCPCDGLFSDPRKNKCFQETLGDLPVKKISSVQRSVRNSTPFDSILYKEANGECIGKKRKAEPRHVELEGEVKNASGFNLLTSQSLKKGSFKIKSKRLSFHRSPYGLRNHCQVSLGHKNFPQSPANVMEYLNHVDENDPLLDNSKEGRKTLEEVSLLKSVSLSAQKKQPERTFSWAGEGTCSSPVETIGILEQERAALALELEKERNAAATAADEALGMILRLQEEKASIGMEARQYQRMIEEKSAFDVGEMSILKEILLRREREKHVLEKEVETYRKMFLETEPNTPDSKPAQIEGWKTQQMTKPLYDMEMDNCFVALGDKSVIPGDYDNAGSPYIDEEIKVNEVDQDISDSKKLGVESHVVVTDEDNKVEVNVPCDHVKLDRSQSVSDTSYGLPQACLRRKSMSAVHYERLKIESEVGLLRGRLRALQKGREKISFKSQVHCLGDKTSRFWEATPLDSSSPSLVKAMSMTLDLHSA